MASILAIIVACHGTPLHAVQPDEILPDAKLEERARNLSRELRCMVCQNQSIDDFDAPLARDLRLLVRERLKEGDSDRQVMDFLTARYGDFVLLNPPMNAKTFLLWVLPAGLLVLGGIVLVLAMRRRRGSATDRKRRGRLSAEEERKIAALLERPADKRLVQRDTSVAECRNRGQNDDSAKPRPSCAIVLFPPTIKTPSNSSKILNLLIF